jgi:hypothetical protein
MMCNAKINASDFWSGILFLFANNLVFCEYSYYELSIRVVIPMRDLTSPPAVLTNQTENTFGGGRTEHGITIS